MKELNDMAQVSLIQKMLDCKAVAGSAVTFVSVGLTEEEQEAMSALHNKQWVKICEEEEDAAGSQELDLGSSFQLTSKPLQSVQVQMVVSQPYPVFARRRALPLKDSTCLELVLTLRGTGWVNQEPVKKARTPPYQQGSSWNVYQSCCRRLLVEWCCGVVALLL